MNKRRHSKKNAREGRRRSKRITHVVQSGGDATLLKTTIPGLKLWLDGKDINGDGTANPASVRTWKDKSGSGNDARSSGTSISSSEGVVFSGSNYFTTNYASNLLPESVFVVITYDNRYNTLGGSAHQDILNSVGNGGRRWTAYDKRTLWSDQGTNTILNYIYPTYTVGNKMLIELHTKADTTVDLYANGVTSGNRTGVAYSATSGGSTIGSEKTVATLSGTISEIICFNTALTNDQMLRVRGYLANKWNIGATLPTGNSYVVDPATTTSAASYNVAFQRTSSYSSSVPWSITGLQLWLDGRDINGNGTANPPSVNTWKDKSGAGNDATLTDKVASNTVPPASTSEGVIMNPGTQSNQAFYTKLLGRPTTESAFLVVNLDNDSGHHTLLCVDASVETNGRDWRMLSNMSYWLNPPNATVNSDTTIAGFPSKTKVLAEAIYSSNGTVKLYINGTLAGSGTSTNTTTSTAGTTIGAGATRGNSLKGMIHEVIVFNRAVTDTEREKIEAYLGIKWGIADDIPSARALAISNRTSLYSGSVPWSITGLKTWFDANDINADGGNPSPSTSNIVAWRDKSNNAYTGTSSSGIGGQYNPTITNGMPGVTFMNSTTTVGNGFKTKALPRSAYCTVFVVFTPSSNVSADVGNTSALWGHYDTVKANTWAADYYNIMMMNNSANPLTLYMQGPSQGATGTLPTGYGAAARMSPPQPVLVSFIAKSSVSSESLTESIYGNGVSVSVGKSYTNNTLPAAPTGDAPVVFGYTTFGGGGPYPLNGSISELIYYDNALSDADIAKVQSYLAVKWGFTDDVPASLPLAISRRTSLYSATVPWSITGLTSWFDASDMNADGRNPFEAPRNVGFWRDKSQNAYNATALTRSDKSAIGGVYNPTVANGMPGVTFGGPNTPTKLSITTSGFQTANVARSSYVTVFMVYTAATAPNSVTSPRALGNIWNQAARVNNVYDGYTLFHYDHSNGPTLLEGATDKVLPVWGNTMTGSTTYLITLTVKNVASNGTSITTLGPGVSETKSANNIANPPPISGSVPITFGYDIASPGNVLNGSISEIIQYNTELSSADVGRVQAYLTAKWGIPSGTPASLPLAVTRRTSLYAESLPWGITGLTCWFDAKDMNADGKAPSTGTTSVTSWLDKSKNCYSASAVSGAGGLYNPTITNGMPGVTFRDNTTVLGSGFSTIDVGRGSEFAVFIVFTPSKTSVTTGNGFLWGHSTPKGSFEPDYPFIYQNRNNGQNGLWGQAAGRFQNVGYDGNYNALSNMSTPQPLLVTLYAKGTSQNGTMYGNGVSVTGSNTATAVAAVSGNAPIIFGYQNVGGTAIVDGSISELIYYSAALSDTDIQKVQGFLTSKWGFSQHLPTNHPYYNAAYQEAWGGIDPVKTASAAAYRAVSGATFQQVSGASFQQVSGASFQGASAATFQGASGVTFQKASGASFQAASAASFQAASAATFQGASAASFQGASRATFEAASGATFQAASGTSFQAASGASFQRASAASFERASGASFQASSGATFQGASGVQFIGDSRAKFVGDSRAQLERDSRAQLEGDSRASFQGVSGASFQGVSGAQFVGDSRAQFVGDSRAQFIGDSRAQNLGDSRAQFQGDSSATYALINMNSGAKFLNDSAAQDLRDSRAQFIGDSRSQYIGDSKANFQGVSGSQFVGDSRANFVGDSRANFVGDSRAQFVGESRSQFVGDSRAQALGDSGAQFVGDSRANFVRDSRAQFIGESGSQYIGESKANFQGVSGAQFVGDSRANFVRDSRAQFIGESGSQYIGDSKANFQGVSGAQFVGDSRANFVRDSRAQFIGESGSQYIGESKANFQGVSGAQFVGDSRANFVRDSRAQFIGDSGSQFVGDSRAQALGDSRAQFVGESGSQFVGDSRANFIGDSKAQLIGDSRAQFIGDSGSHYAGDSRATFNTASSATALVQQAAATLNQFSQAASSASAANALSQQQANLAKSITSGATALQNQATLAASAATGAAAILRQTTSAASVLASRASSAAYTSQVSSSGATAQLAAAIAKKDSGAMIIAQQAVNAANAQKASAAQLQTDAITAQQLLAANTNAASGANALAQQLSAQIATTSSGASSAIAAAAAAASAAAVANTTANKLSGQAATFQLAADAAAGQQQAAAAAAAAAGAEAAVSGAQALAQQQASSATALNQQASAAVSTASAALAAANAAYTTAQNNLKNGVSGASSGALLQASAAVVAANQQQTSATQLQAQASSAQVQADRLSATASSAAMTLAIQQSGAAVQQAQAAAAAIQNQAAVLTGEIQAATATASGLTVTAQQQASAASVAASTASAAMATASSAVATANAQLAAAQADVAAGKPGSSQALDAANQAVAAATAQQASAAQLQAQASTLQQQAALSASGASSANAALTQQQAAALFIQQQAAAANLQKQTVAAEQLAAAGTIAASSAAIAAQQQTLQASSAGFQAAIANASAAAAASSASAPIAAYTQQASAANALSQQASAAIATAADALARANDAYIAAQDDLVNGVPGVTSDTILQASAAVVKATQQQTAATQLQKQASSAQAVAGSLASAASSANATLQPFITAANLATSGATAQQQQAAAMSSSANAAAAAVQQQAAALSDLQINSSVITAQKNATATSGAAIAASMNASGAAAKSLQLASAAAIATTTASAAYATASSAVAAANAQLAIARIDAAAGKPGSSGALALANQALATANAQELSATQLQTQASTLQQEASAANIVASGSARAAQIAASAATVAQGSVGVALGASSANFQNASSSHFTGDSRAQYVQDSAAQDLGDSGAQYMGDSRANYMGDSRANYMGDSRAQYANVSAAQNIGDSRAQFAKDSRAQFVGDSMSRFQKDSAARFQVASAAQDLGDSRAQFMGDSRAQFVGDSRAQFVGDSRAQYVGDSRAQYVGDSRAQLIQDSAAQDIRDSAAQFVGDSRAQYVGDSRAQSIGDSRAQFIGDSRAGFLGASSAKFLGASSAKFQGASAAQNMKDSRAQFIGDSKAQFQASSGARFEGDSRAQNMRDSRSQYLGDSRAVFLGDSRAVVEGASAAQALLDSRAQDLSDSGAQFLGDSRAVFQGASAAQDLGDSKAQYVGESGANYITSSSASASGAEILSNIGYDPPRGQFVTPNRSGGMNNVGGLQTGGGKTKPSSSRSAMPDDLTVLTNGYSGRYVRVRPPFYSGDGFMAISQIIVYDIIGLNVAPSANVYATSSIDGTNSPISVVDGNLTIRDVPNVWHSATPNREKEYIELDLGSTINIFAVRILGVNTCPFGNPNCHERLDNMRIEIRADGDPDIEQDALDTYETQVLDAQAAIAHAFIVKSLDTAPPVQTVKITQQAQPEIGNDPANGSFTLPTTDSDQTINVDEYLGRYIRLRPSLTNGDGFINLSQVIVYDALGQNISKGKNTYATSSISGTKPSSIVVDGTTDIRSVPDIWHSNSRNRDTEFFEIDLGSNETVFAVRIIGRKGCPIPNMCENRMLGLRLEIRDTTTVEAMKAYESKPQKVADLSGNQQANTVQVQSVSSNSSSVKLTPTSLLGLPFVKSWNKVARTYEYRTKTGETAIPRKTPFAPLVTDLQILTDPTITPPWYKYFDTLYRVYYYYNKSTGQTTWAHPYPPRLPVTGETVYADDGLPKGWYKYLDSALNTYFYYNTTGEITWDHPNPPPFPDNLTPVSGKYEPLYEMYRDPTTNGIFYYNTLTTETFWTLPIGLKV
jgi:Concanavalin A-like lectin/glucanases superfamily